MIRHIKSALAVAFIVTVCIIPIWCAASVVDVWAGRAEESYSAWNVFNIY